MNRSLCHGLAASRWPVLVNRALFVRLGVVAANGDRIGDRGGDDRPFSLRPAA